MKKVAVMADRTYYTTVAIRLAPGDQLAPDGTVDVSMDPLPITRGGSPQDVIGFADVLLPDGDHLLVRAIIMDDDVNLNRGQLAIVGTPERSRLKADDTRELHHVAITALDWTPA